MTSAVTICNTALGMLGDDPIQTLTGAEKRAKLCNAFYEQLRDRLLRMHPWAFATKRVLLAPTTTVPAFDWGYTYLLPADCLRVLQVGEAGIRPSYELEGRNLLTNESSLPLVYVWKNTDEQSWDAQFVDLLTAALAKQLAYPITKSPPMQEAMGKEFEMQRRRAGAVNGQENEPRDMPASTIQTARY